MASEAIKAAIITAVSAVLLAGGIYVVVDKSNTQSDYSVKVSVPSLPTSVDHNMVLRGGPKTASRIIRGVTNLVAAKPTQVSPRGCTVEHISGEKGNVTYCGVEPSSNRRTAADVTVSRMGLGIRLL